MEIFSLMGTVAISKDKALKDIKSIQTQAEKTSTAMGKSFTKFSGYVEKHSAQIKAAGKYMTIFGGIATAAFALSVKSAANFEEQLANVSTMLDESAMKILPEYRRELQSLSVEFGEATETLSKGLYDILSASIPPAEALSVLEISARAAAAGITDTGVAADAITTILNSYGFSADQAGMVSDKLFAIVKEGKTCVTGETKILLSDGRYERIDSLRSGAEVLSWTGKNFIPIQATFHALGKKKIIHIKTAFGREIRTTAEHPYLTPDGWKEVQELRIGDKIAVPSSLPIFGNLEPRWQGFPKLLGYLISEGYICRGTPIISSSSKEIINDIKNIVSSIGLKISLNKKRSGNVNIGIVTHLGPGNTGENPLANELKRLGIYGSKSKTKFVPKEVFEWKPKYILEFIEGLFNGDGWLRKLEQKNSHIPQREIIRDENGRFRNIRYKKIGNREVKKFQVGYSSASKQLVSDVSHLLLRFGINGTIAYGRNKFSGIYSWQTSRFSEISQFISLINLKRDRVQEFREYKQVSHQLRDISSGIYFARIKSKVEEPEEEVFDLTVPLFHNFVANDIVAHNTFAELAPSIGKVAATASMAGLDFDDLGASIATMTRAGIRTEETMTAINGVLIAFLKPTDEAKEAAAKFGLELNTTTLQTLGMTGVMEKLTDATAEQLAAIFPNIRGLKGMAAALGDAEGYAKSYALMLNSAGLTQEAFEKQSATLNFKLGQLKEMFNVIKVTIGTALMPAVEDITKKIMGVLTKVKEWTEANPKLTATMVKWAAGISGLMLVAGPLLIALPSLVSGVNLLIGVTPGLVAALGKIKIALAGVAGQALLIGANIIIWSEVWREWQKIANSTKVTQDDVTDSLIRLSNAQLVAAEKLGIPVQEFVRMQKEGKSVTEMMDTLANKFPGYADALNVWTIAAVEQQVNAKLIVTTVKDLTQGMSLLTKEYGAGSQAISESITYYNSMIDLLNRTDVILQTELMLLERGTEEWHKKKEEIADNTKALNEINKELARLIEPLEGLELIAAKMALLGDSTEDTKKKIELLNEKAILLQQALDEAIPDTAAWWEAKIAFEGNQVAIDGLKEKLKELTEEEKEAVRLADKLADAYKSITDKIYELTHTPMETAIYKLDQQKQAYLDLGVAIDIVNKWHDAEIAKLEESNVALDEHKDKLVEATEVTEKLGILGGEVWEGLTARIKHTTTTLNTFTKEGVAAAIAKIKMHFKSLIDHIRETTLAATGIWARMAEANIASLEASMAKQIGIVKYGYEEYLKILASMEKAGGGGGVGYDLGGIIKGLQRGGGVDSVLIRATPGEYVVDKPMTDFIKRTGIVPSQLTKAIVSGQPTPAPGMQRGGIVGLGTSPEIKYDIGPIYVAGDGDVGKIRSAIKQALDESNLQILRSGSEVIPGVG